ncbi:MAG TPA: TonB-dependent receptor [Bryobacteraceae bacterium]|nr:TonB-dependent receptor [Bryobacteraceae bacterium]
MRTVTQFVSAAVIAIASLTFALPTHAQVLYGSIVGQVADSSNAIVPGATVRLTNNETGQTRLATTNASGEYTFQTLPGGTYDITVTKDGFQTFSAKGVSLAAGQVARMDATLRLGAVTETISVNAEAAALQTDRAEVRSEVTAKQLENLPTPLGRNYENLLVMVPGLSPPANNHSVAVNPSRGLSFSAAGTTRNSNSVRIEGAIANNTWLPHVNAYVPALEAIESVSVVTGSFDADQGLSGGSSVNVQMKSGTNQVHGSVFEYHSDNAIKAKPFFIPAGQQKPKAINNQFGATFGGPIKRNKLFYFASYEGSLDRQSAAQILTVPTAAIRAGDMSASANAIYDPLTGAADGSGRTPFDNKRVPTARIDPIATKILADLPLPNLPGLTNNFYANGPFALSRHKLDTKGNWNATDKLTFTGRLGWLDYSFENPGAFGKLVGPGVSSAAGKLGPGYGDTYSLTFSSTYAIRPSLILDGYISWTLINTNAEPPRLDEKLGLDYLGLPGTNGPSREYGGWPQFSVTSYAAMGNPGSGSAGGPVVERNRQRQYTANLSWTKGTHSFRFGGDIVRQGLNRFETGASAGAFTFDGGATALRGGPSSNQFNSFATFLLGFPTAIQKSLIPFDNNRNTTKSYSYSFFAKDQWQATRKLTLSYGVRWDRFPMGSRESRGLERYNFDTNQMLICGVANVPKDCGYDIPWTNFSPRVGLAYRVTDSFVIRAGYGINYDPYPLAFVRDLIGNYPSGLNLSLTAANSFQFVSPLKNGIPAIVVPDISSGIIPVPAAYAARALTQEVKRGYIESFNFTLQKQLPWGFTGQAGYVGSRQIHISQILNLNAGQVLGAGTAGQPFFQKFGRTANTELLGPVGTNKYDSLQTTLTRRFSKGFQAQVSYTWSKVIGICCDELSDNPPRVQALSFFGLNRALMPYDRTHNFNASFVAELPFGKGKPMLNGGLGSAIAGGWQVNGLLSIYSGSPFTVTASDTLSLPGSNQRADQIKPSVAIFGDPASYFDPLAYAPVTGARFGTSGYDSLRGPGTKNFDFSLYRTFRITERFSAQFRAEALNLTNTPHFSNPGSNVSNLQLNTDGSVRNLGGFTVITSTSGIGREGVDERVFRFGLRIAF